MRFQVGDIVVVKTVEEIIKEHGSLERVYFMPRCGVMGQTGQVIKRYINFGVDLDILPDTGYTIMDAVLRPATAEEIDAHVAMCKNLSAAFMLLGRDKFGCQTSHVEKLCWLLAQDVR